MLTLTSLLAGEDIEPENELHLLTLPAEIRNNIFENVAVVRNPKGERVVLNATKARLYASRICAPLATNKQMSHELTALFYGNNIFQFEVKHDIQYPGTEKYKATMERGLKLSQIETYEGEDSGRNLEYSGDYSFIQLPCRKLRALMKNVVFIVDSPSKKKDAHGKFEYPPAKDGDWLHPIRSLKALGFGTLEDLTIEVVSYNGSRSETDIEAKLEAVVQQRVNDMKVDARNIKITYRARDPDSWFSR